MTLTDVEYQHYIELDEEARTEIRNRYTKKELQPIHS